MIAKKINFNIYMYLLLPGLILSVFAVPMFLYSVEHIYLYILVAVQSYLIGCTPFGYLIHRIRTGEDIRNYGSGKIGTSNVFRTSGGVIGLLVLCLDASKGIAVIYICRQLFIDESMLVISTLLALVGHNWPVILSFKGGRGIAIAAGTLLVLTTIQALIGLAIFLPVTLISKYLSLGSILGVIGAVISIVIMTFFGIYPIQYSVYGIIAGVVIIFQHRDNIKRIMSRTERKIGQPAVKIK